MVAQWKAARNGYCFLALDQIGCPNWENERQPGAIDFRILNVPFDSLSHPNFECV